MIAARWVVAAAVILAGCDSLIDGACRPGYGMVDGRCVAREVPDAGGGPSVTDAGADAADAGTSSDAGDDAGPDAGPDATLDAGVDAPACTAEVASDPYNCGACGHVCASGLCAASHCVGDPWGHVVTIGHDFTASTSAARRLLANAAALGTSPDLAIAWWAADQASMAHVPALTAGLAALGRPWHAVTFPATPSASAFATVDVVIVGPLAGDGAAHEAAGAPWAAALDGFLRRGGVVLVLDGATTHAHRFARGAGLYSVGAPGDATGQHAVVVAPTDAVVHQVPTPYLAERSSASFPGAAGAVVTTPGGDPIVFHLTR